MTRIPADVAPCVLISLGVGFAVRRRRPVVRVGYEYEPGRITYWSPQVYRTLAQARYWAGRLNRRGDLPGCWVVRA